MTAQTEVVKKDSIAKVAFAALIATTMEFYDFFIYGTVAALAFGTVFFPSNDPMLSLLSAYATFAVGFIARPLGGLIFGHYGDKVGRKKMLVIAMLLMGVTTFAIGCLPPYAQVGVISPILLTVCRVLQGIALGGQWGGAALMLLENAPKDQRGLWGSLAQMGASCGLILGTGVLAIFSGRDDFLDWGWRVPFLLSAVLVIAGMAVRMSIKESHVVEKVKSEGKALKVPLKELFRHQAKNVFLGAGIGATNNTTFYCVSVIALSYGTTTLGLPRSTMVNALLIVSAVYCLTLPFFAKLSDRFGRKSIIRLSLILTILMAFPYFAMMKSGSFFLIVLAMTVLLSVIQSMSYSVQGAFFPELFDPRYRYTGSSLCANLATSCFGGTAPFIFTALLSWSGGDTLPLSIYIICVSVMSLICLYFVSETYKTDVEEYHVDTGSNTNG